MPKILYVEYFKIGDPYFENLPIDLEILIVDYINASLGNCIKNLPFSLRCIYIDMYRKYCDDIEFITPFGCKIEFRDDKHPDTFGISHHFRSDHSLMVIRGISKLRNYTDTDINIKSDKNFLQPTIVGYNINLILYNEPIENTIYRHLSKYNTK